MKPLNIALGATCCLVMLSCGGSRPDSPQPPSEQIAKPISAAAPATQKATPAPRPIPAKPPEPESKWFGGAGAPSAMDDSPTVVFTLRADNEISGWLKKETPTLIVRCSEKRTAVYVENGMSPQPEYGKSNQASVRIRFDAAPAKAEVWTESTDNEALFSPQPIPFLRAMVKAERLLFQFTPFNSPPVIVEFTVRGFGDRLGVVQDTCGWK